MGCFSINWIESMLINLVWIIAIISIVKLLVPFLAGLIGGTIGPLVAQIVSIICWAVVAVFVIIVIFSLLQCLVGGGGLTLFPLPRMLKLLTEHDET
jgi:hypothetical protein